MSNPAPGKKFHGNEILRDLIPLNALTRDRFREVTGSLVIEDIGAGSYLFGEGDCDNRSIYLLDGVINLLDSNGRVTGVVSAGTDPARYPIANQQPRITTARAATKSVVATIDSTLLDVMLTLDQTTTTASTTGLYTDSNEDWMTRVLQSDAFIKLAPADIQRLLQTLQSVTVSAGDTIIRQGDEGDYFYIIKEGSCSVTRLASGEGWDVPLAELGKGDCFGEEALVSDANRNATVTMLTDGTLMRLSKKDFVELLKDPLVHFIDYDLASSLVADGGVWLDVRLADEHANFAFRNSSNVPLASIRDKASALDAAKKYVVYCDTGRRSTAAAFLLSQRGFDVCVLDGGLNTGAPVDSSSLVSDAPVGPGPVQRPPGEQPAGGLSLAEPCEQAVTPASRTPAILPGSGDQDLAELRATLSALQSEFATYGDVVKRMASACAEEQQARSALNDRLERLFARLNQATNRSWPAPDRFAET
jgi:CRP-like cAMP-binding protein